MRLLFVTSHALRTRAQFSTSSALFHLKEGDRRGMMNSMPVRDEGVVGEHSIELDSSGYHKLCEFPDANTPNRIFDDLPFKDLPIVNVRATRNNTIMSLTRADGRSLVTRSCGMEGFKNCRKATNIAAQTTAVGLANRALKLGVKTVRLRIKGLGAGRASSVKGLQMGGMNIVSITDYTPISEFPEARPRAAKSL